MAGIAHPTNQMIISGRRTHPAIHALAVGAFAIAALWPSRAVLRDPAALVTVSYPDSPLLTSDVRRNIAQTAYASRLLAREPWRFFEGAMCYPTPNSVSLGEHMLGEGLLGVPASLLTNDPVVTFNSVVIARPLIGAVSMYALAYYWTGSPGAALIAGFLFGFHPMRLRDLAHPSVVGNEILPAILLALQLLFAGRRWRDAFLLAALAALQMLESFYVLLQLALVGAIYGTYLLWRYRGALTGLLPKLAVVAVALGALAFWVLGPYLATREIWGVLQDRTGLPTVSKFVHFGGHRFVGVCLLLLASAGMLDRLRGARSQHGHDPRLPMATLALAANWFVLSWQVPGTDFAVPPLDRLLRAWLPGLDAVRAPGNVQFLAAVPLGLMAAYGVLALVEKLSPKARMIVSAGLALGCVAEVFHPRLASVSFGSPLPTSTLHVRPAAEDLAALRNLPPGPVLDIPLSYEGAGSLYMSRAVLFGAYHQRRLAACRASFVTPVQTEIAAIVDRLPSSHAAQEIWALGLRTIIFSGQTDKDLRRLADEIIERLSKPKARPRLQPIASGRTLRVYRLEAGRPMASDFASLVPIARKRSVLADTDIAPRFGVQSATGRTFRHPDPVQPTEVLVRWMRDDAVVQSAQRRVLLPLVLAPGHKAEIVVADRAPRDAAIYQVTLAPADQPEHIIGAQRVSVIE